MYIVEKLVEERGRMDSHLARCSRGSVLIVDDKPDNIDLLYRLLSRKGFDVEVAYTGEMALSLVQSNPPEIILLDVCMPDMDGYQVCQALKAASETKNIPIIFVSGFDEVLDKMRAFKVGAVDYITKPFHTDEVVARVSNHLALRQLQRQLEEQNERLQQEVRDRLATEAVLQAANQELQRLAHLDGLTQVANRRSFDNSLSQEWRRLAREQQPLSLILCDVDYFKIYNDTYGHQAGDDCLRNIVSAISMALKRPGDFVARYGGEEFAVILPNTPLDGAMQVAKQIRVAVRALEMQHSGSQVSEFVTLSLGVSAVVPFINGSPMALIAAADRALYRAKQEGRDRISLEAVHFSASS